LDKSVMGQVIDSENIAAGVGDFFVADVAA
jgi:hypothetical protein